MVNIDEMIARCSSRVNSNVLIGRDIYQPHNRRMTVEDNRLENLKLLIKEFGSAAEVARLSGTAASYLSQIINRVPSRTGKPRDIGAELARKLENGCGKFKGWMDESESSEIVSEEQRKFLDLMRRMSDEDKQTWFKVGTTFATAKNHFDKIQRFRDGGKHRELRQNEEHVDVERRKTPWTYKGEGNG